MRLGLPVVARSRLFVWAGAWARARRVAAPQCIPAGEARATEGEQPLPLPPPQPPPPGTRLVPPLLLLGLGALLSMALLLLGLALVPQLSPKQAQLRKSTQGQVPRATEGQLARGIESQLPKTTGGQVPRTREGQVQLLRSRRGLSRRPLSGSCWSRGEMPLLLRRAFAPSPAFSLRLRQYQTMHRRCAAQHNWADFSSSSSSSSSDTESSSNNSRSSSSSGPLEQGCQHPQGCHQGCQYLVYREIEAGLGNRLLDLVSAFAYALLTDRALMIAPGGFLPALLCNPFAPLEGLQGFEPGKGLRGFQGLEPSPWLVSLNQWGNVTAELALEKEREILKSQLENPEGETLMGSNLETWRGGGALGLDLTWEAPAKNSVFFCQRNQDEVVRHFRVIVFTSGQHLLPAHHFVPSFDEALREWFPEGHEFLHLGRFMIHPVNRLWLRIRRYYEMHLRRHGRLVGVQVRQFREEDEVCVDERVLECLSDAAEVLSGWLPEEEVLGLRPRRMNSTVGAATAESAAADTESTGVLVTAETATAMESTGILVTALNATHADVLSDFIRRHVPPLGQDAAVYRISNERVERAELGQFELALMEMLLLSFSDVLLTTYFSTFGNVASGLSGGPTYLLNIVVRLQADWRQSGRPACERASPEPCQHTFPGGTLRCGAKERNITEVSPLVSVCDALNAGLQYQLPNITSRLQ